LFRLCWCFQGILSKSNPFFQVYKRDKDNNLKGSIINGHYEKHVYLIKDSSISSETDVYFYKTSDSLHYELLLHYKYKKKENLFTCYFRKENNHSDIPSTKLSINQSDSV
jgi:hypothetical protein